MQLTPLFNAHRNAIGKISQQHSRNSESFFRSVFFRELLLKGDTKRGRTIRDYDKPSRKCPPKVSAPLLLFSWITFLFLVFACGARLVNITLFSGDYIRKAAAIVLTDSPSILGYLTLLPPTYVDFAARKAIDSSSLRLVPTMIISLLVVVTDMVTSRILCQKSSLYASFSVSTFSAGLPVMSITLTSQFSFPSFTTSTSY